jgi:hypothetical protein
MYELSYGTQIVLLGIFLVCAVTCYNTQKIIDLHKLLSDTHNRDKKTD